MLVIWGLLLGQAMTAWGHSDLDPRQSIPKKWETYTLNVPTETEVPTVKTRLFVPPEFEIEVIEHSRVWRITTVRDGRGYIREISWSGDSIPPQTFEEFRFLARNPTTTGTYRWKIEQHYQRGEPATWEAQTQIVARERAGTQRAEEAWRTAQVATTVSLVAIGISVTLIIITIIGIVQNGRKHVGDDGL
jgi:uncharacterized protein YcnI